MSGMRLLSLGTGDAFSAQRYSSCCALEADGRWLLIDCPHPLRKMWREAAASAGLALDLDCVSGCVLTHLHGDHASGLEMLAFYFRYGLQRRLPLLCHADVAADLWPRHLAGAMEWSIPAAGQPPVQHRFDEYFDWRPLAEEGTVSFGPFTVRCRRTLHHIPTFALIVAAAGRSIGFSADTAFEPALIDWLAQADRIVHEASTGALHSPYEKLASLPAELRAKMWLIHYPDQLDPNSLVIEALREGRLYGV